MEKRIFVKETGEEKEEPVSEGRLGESVLGGNSRSRGAETQMWERV